MIANKLKMGMVGVLIAGLVGFSAVSSFAASVTLNAPVTVLESLTFGVASTPIDFGTIESPTVDSVILVNFLGIRSLVSGDATLSGGTPLAGSTVINGTPGQLVTLSATPGACTAGSGLTIDNILSAASGVTLVSGTATVAHGANLNVSAGAAAGDQTCEYDIIANY